MDKLYIYSPFYPQPRMSEAVIAQDVWTYCQSVDLEFSEIAGYTPCQVEECELMCGVGVF